MADPFMEFELPAEIHRLHAETVAITRNFYDAPNCRPGHFSVAIRC
jgi:hypothetical protein